MSKTYNTRLSIEYKGVDNNKYIIQYFGELSINTQNDYILKPIMKLFDTESKQCYTSLGQLEGFESIIIINTLADNAFKH